MKAWDDRWRTEEGRALWVEPDPLVASLVPRFKEEGVAAVLDLGFGVGRHVVLFAREGFDVYGIETSPAGVEYAENWLSDEKLSAHLGLGDMGHLPFPPDTFDLAIAWNVIYHGTSDRIGDTLGEIRRCLKTDGYFLGTLISTKHASFGVGVEVEPGTYVNPAEAEKSHPHHYFGREEVHRYLRGFALLECRDVEQFRPGDYHWHILARLESKLQGPG